MAVIFLSACCVVGCSQRVTTNDSAKTATPASAKIAVGGDIPYTVANRYFVRNDLSALPPTKITSETEFNACFGMATVMRPDGKPTPIDFKQQFVISVALPETNIHTEIVPVGLRKGDDGNIIFSYQVKRGEEMSSTIQPSLLIIVDRKHDGTVVLDPKETREL